MRTTRTADVAAVVALAVVAVLLSVAAPVAAQGDSTAAAGTENATETGAPTADPMGVTDSPVPGFGAVPALVAVAAATLAMRARHRRE